MSKAFEKELVQSELCFGKVIGWLGLELFTTENSG